MHSPLVSPGIPISRPNSKLRELQEVVPPPPRIPPQLRIPHLLLLGVIRLPPLSPPFLPILQRR